MRMKHCRAAALAITSLLTVTLQIARADEPTTDVSAIQPHASELAPGTVPNAPNAARQPLMLMLDRTGLGSSLEAARINIFGHIEGSYTWNFDNPAQNLNLGREFDIEHNKGLVNQIDLNVERQVDLTSKTLDVGGRIEMLYGTDARFIHSSGMFDDDDFFHGPEYQFDIPQLYVDVGLPVGNGLRVRAGKFLFFKQIDPNSSVFYSHSFSFGSALPFTLTGVTGYYPISDQLNVEAGISRGWGQTLKDNNGSPDALGRVRYMINNRTDITLAAIIGPELDHDNSHYRSVFDFTFYHALTDQFTIMADAVYGYQAEPAGKTAAMWYGASGYAVYQLSDYLALAGRVEWYRDEEGFTTAQAQNLFEGTIGLTITPFPHDSVGRNLRIRPELRYDYSTRAYFDAFSRHDQTTAAIDAYFDF